MGRKRTEPDEALYQKRRAYYQTRRASVLEKAKIYYADHGDIMLAAMRAGREAVKRERLLVKRRILYGERYPRLPDVQYASCQEFVRQAKANRPCLDCGRTYPHYVMDFDHVRGVKKRNISDLKTVKSAQAEIEKCDLVCSNCHRERTFTRIK